MYSGDYGENESPGSSHRKSSVGLWLEQKNGPCRLLVRCLVLGGGIIFERF